VGEDREEDILGLVGPLGQALRFPRSLEEADPLPHVPDGRHYPQPPVSTHQREADLGRELRAVLAAGSQGDAAPHPTLACGGARPWAVLGLAGGALEIRGERVGLGYQDLDRLAPEFRGPITEEGLSLGVGDRDAAFGVDHHQRVRRLPEQPRTAAYALHTNRLRRRSVSPVWGARELLDGRKRDRGEEPSYVFVSRRVGGVKLRGAVGGFGKHAVEQQAMEVNIELEAAAEALNHRHGAAP